MAAFLESILGIPVSGTAALAIAVVLLLLAVALIWLLVRFFRQPRFAGKRGKQARLAITDAARVDDRRRLVLVRRDDVEHLIMIGGVTDLLIETDIRRTAPARALTHVEEEKPASATPPQPVQREPVAETKVTPKTEPEVAAEPVAKRSPATASEWPGIPPAPKATASKQASAGDSVRPTAPSQSVPTPPIPVSAQTARKEPTSTPDRPVEPPSVSAQSDPALPDPAAPSTDAKVTNAAPSAESAKRSKATEEMEALLSGLKPQR